MISVSDVFNINDPINWTIREVIIVTFIKADTSSTPIYTRHNPV